MNDRVSIELLTAMRQKGLPEMAMQLQKRLKYPLAILDGQGQMLWSGSGAALSGNERVARLPDEKYHYDKKQAVLTARLQNDGDSLYIRCFFVSLADSEAIKELLSAAELAAVFYLRLQKKAQTRFAAIEEDLMERLFFRPDGHFDDVMAMAHFNLNTDKPYVIQLIKIIGASSPENVRNVIAQMAEYTGEQQLPSMQPIFWRGYLVHIIPALYQRETFDLCQEWPEVKVSEVFRAKVKSALQLELAIGIGGIYSLGCLAKSFEEARLALAFRGLAENGGYVQRFADMGFFCYVFGRPLEQNKKYVETLLGPVLAYDNERGTEFLQCLRILLANGMNWKETAEVCGVHVNTIYYRIERIEKMLQRDLRRPGDKFDLFAAVKIWDVLNALGSVEAAYVGRLKNF